MQCNLFVTFDRFVKHVLELKVLLISKLASKVCLEQIYERKVIGLEKSQQHDFKKVRLDS